MGNSANVSEFKNDSLTKTTNSSFPKRDFTNESFQNLDKRKMMSKSKDQKPHHVLTKIDWSGIANEVFLTGSFNNWTKIKMSIITQNYFVCELVS